MPYKALLVHVSFEKGKKKTSLASEDLYKYSSTTREKKNILMLHEISTIQYLSNNI